MAESDEGRNEFEISERFMTGDLIKAVLRRLREQQIGWNMMTEQGQQMLIDSITLDVKGAVRSVIDILQARKCPSVHANVESVTFKTGIKATLTFSKEMADRHEIADAVGKDVLIVLPQYELALGGDKPKASAQQDLTL